MPPQRTRTSNWSGCTSGVGTCSTRRSPGAWMTRASIVDDLQGISERGGDTAVDVEDVTVDEVRRIAGQEHGGADQVLHVTPAARRRAADQPARELGIVDERLGQFGLEVAWSEPIDLDVVLAPVDRHAFGQHLHRALARCVGGNVRSAQLALHRADVDDLAATAIDQVAPDA